MDNSLKELESQLEGFVPRGLSDEGYARCHSLIDSLVAEKEALESSKRPDRSWLRTGAAAAVALGIGVGGGWYLGNEPSGGKLAKNGGQENGSGSVVDFEELDRESWVLKEDAPDIYVARNGEVREISRQVELTKEVVKHKESGVVVTVETTDHHVVDSVKSDF